MLTTPVIRESSLKPIVPFLLDFVMDRFVIVKKIEESSGCSKCSDAICNIRTMFSFKLQTSLSLNMVGKSLTANEPTHQLLPLRPVMYVAN